MISDPNPVSSNMIHSVYIADAFPMAYFMLVVIGYFTRLD